MRNKELLDYYLHTSKDDRRVCLKLLDDKEYLPSLFYAHLSIEKLLKGLILKNTRQLPPFIHQLDILLKRSGHKGVVIEYLPFLKELNDYHVLGRYPDLKNNVKRSLRGMIIYDKINTYLDLYKIIWRELKP